MASKVLVVDDEVSLARLVLQKFRKNIRAAEFEFIFAQNGVEALEKLQQDPQVDMVITDINMPEMDGFTLIERLHDIDPTIKAVVVSAYEDVPNIRAALRRGAFDFLTKPINFTELEHTINRTLQYVHRTRHAQHQLQQVQTQQIQLTHAINESIHLIDHNLLPICESVQYLINLIHLYQQNCSHVAEAAITTQLDIDQSEVSQSELVIEELQKRIDLVQIKVKQMSEISFNLQTECKQEHEVIEQLVELHENPVIS